MDQEARLNIVLHANQEIIHQSSARWKVVKAGKRFGKTKWAIFELCQEAGMNPRKVYWYIAPTYRQAKSIAWYELKWILPQQFVRRSVETELMIELWNGARIELKGADNEDSLRGTGLGGVIFDEAAYIKESLWLDIVRSQLVDTLGFAYFISTPKGKNWFTSFHTEARRKRIAGDKEWESFYFTSLQNPTLNREELMKVKDTTPEATWNQEYLAIEQDFVGQKYSEFNFDNNVEELKIDKPMLNYRGIDWGSDHPTTCLWAKVDQGSKTVYITREYFKSGLLINENVKNIIDISGQTAFEWSVIDPSAHRRDPATGKSIKDEFARWGLYCVDGDNRGANSIGGRGVDIVKMFLKSGKVKIHPGCKNLIRELQTLEWGDKNGDDCADALRYLLVKLHDTVLGNIFEVEQKAEQAKILRVPQKYNVSDLPSYNKPQTSMSWLMEEVA